MNMQDFYTGHAFDAYEFFGAHTYFGGTHFAVWAPSAQHIAVETEIGTFDLHRTQSAVWECDAPGVQAGMVYQYWVRGANGQSVAHCDPYGTAMTLRPDGRSIVSDAPKGFADDKWMQERTKCFDKPLNIYEVHAGSWRQKEDGSWYTYAELADLLPDDYEAEHEPPALRLAMLGRPNAGKSSMINALAGEERMIVSDVAGTTRDSVDVRFERDGQDYVFVDTAGVRRRTKITDIVEKYSVNAALKSTTKADVTLLTLDATEGVSQQDKRLMDLLDTRKIPFMVLVNKCDLVPAGQLKQLLQNVSEMLAFCKHVPILTVSALKGTGLNKILPMARKIHEECAIRVPTGQLNRAMEEVLTRHQPPVVKRVRAKFFYLTQAESQPPTFVFFVSDADRVPESYARYLERALRRIFGITHAPMRLHLRSSHKKSQ